jgi:hypothetical protein
MREAVRAVNKGYTWHRRLLIGLWKRRRLQYHGEVACVPANIDEWVDGDGDIYEDFGASGEVSISTAMFSEWMDVRGN